MKDSNFIFNWTERLKSEISLMPFSEDDIRKDFISLIYDVSYAFYRGFILLKISELINKHQIAFDTKVYNDFKIHAGRISETVNHPTLITSHINALNRQLLVDSWSTFELCITTLCESVLNENEKEKLLEHQYRDITKTLKQTEIVSEELNRLKRITKKYHLTHVPISRKIDTLFKKTTNYKRNIKRDKDFLNFLGKFRNTIHTNFIYHGVSFEYSFGEAHYLFEDNKIVKWSDPFRPSPRLFFHQTRELIDIWRELVMRIEYSGEILYPDLEQG